MSSLDLASVKILEPSFVKSYRFTYRERTSDGDTVDICGHVYVYRLGDTDVHVIEVEMFDTDYPSTYYVQGEPTLEVIRNILQKHCEETPGCVEILDVEDY